MYLYKIWVASTATDTSEYELTQELMARPAIEPVPLERRRTCAQCGDVFAAVVEGGQCMGSRPFDFLCSLCWGVFSSSISSCANNRIP